MNESPCFLPCLELVPLTPDDEPNELQTYDDDPPCTWLEDSECQENLFQILPLNPEETVVDSNNHIQTHIKLFFEELGYLTEEPEPIDPNVDYEALNEALMKERNNKLRRHHIDLSRLPSLDRGSIRSGISSSSSSTQHDDVRSPHFMGHLFPHPPMHDHNHLSYHYPIDVKSHQPHPHPPYHASSHLHRLSCQVQHHITTQTN